MEISITPNQEQKLLRVLFLLFGAPIVATVLGSLFVMINRILS